MAEVAASVIKGKRRRRGGAGPPTKTTVPGKDDETTDPKDSPSMPRSEGAPIPADLQAQLDAERMAMLKKLKPQPVDSGDIDPADGGSTAGTPVGGRVPDQKRLLLGGDRRADDTQPSGPKRGPSQAGGDDSVGDERGQQ